MSNSANLKSWNLNCRNLTCRNFNCCNLKSPNFNCRNVKYCAPERVSLSLSANQSQFI